MSNAKADSAGSTGSISAQHVEGPRHHPFAAEHPLGCDPGAEGLGAQLALVQCVLDNARESAIITDLNGRIRYVNRAFELTTGYLREDVLGRSPSLLKGGVQNEAVYAELWATLTSGRTWAGRLINRRRDGSRYPDDVMINPIKRASGETVGYMSLQRDVSDDVRVANRLRYEQRFETLGRAVSGILHDFNNLMAAVTGYASLAMTDLPPEHPAREDLDGILDATRRAKALIAKLLTLRSTRQAACETADAALVGSGIMQLARRLIPAAIALHLHINGEGLVASIAPSDLEQVLLNLLLNARDAISGSGRIKIELDAHTGSGIDDSRPGREWIRLRVSDTGSGVPEHIRGELFEPFVTTEDEQHGTRLGLSTVHGLVASCGGHIHFETGDGVGTVFTILLPRGVATTPDDRGAT